MKIAILSFYSGYVQRGVENWAYQLSNYLAHKHEVWVIQNWPEKRIGVKYNVYSTKIPINWKIHNSRGTLLRRVFLDYQSLLIAFFTLKSLPFLWKGNFDLVIPTNGGWQPAFVRIITWLRRKKMVIVGHSGIGWDDRNNLWCFPDSFVALSSHAKSWSEKANPFVKVVYIPNGVDIGLFKPNGRKIKVGLKEPIILMVGALEKSKRMELAIEAVSRLRKGSLLILGSGCQEEEIKRIGRKKLGKRFLLKEVNFSNIPLYYRSASVFTLPSWSNEAFGMVYLEALASGLPVVATKDKLREEIIDGAGILVDPEDIRSYSQALEKAIYTDWRNKPRKQAEKFSWDKVGEEYICLFEKLVKN